MFTVRRACWETDKAQIRQMRDRVFIQEMSIPAELEWDGQDPQAEHVLALDDSGNPVGTGRLLANGSIGRMAVLRDWRRRGVGSALLTALLELGQEKGFQTICLDAQKTVIKFYQTQGFIAVGSIFTKAGIPHQPMQLDMTDNNSSTGKHGL